MKLAIPNEAPTGETRVAASPDTVKKLIALGFEIVVESGAGAASSWPDEAYTDAGASIAAPGLAYGDAAVLLKVQRPTKEEIRQLPDGAYVAAIMAPHGDAAVLADYAAKGLTTFAMDLMPRITRAQSMDVLSSQSNLAGYKAVIEAAAIYGRAMPMMMTAAGAIAPAKVFVMGAGVAGLQAIATARRLGAVVSATDVRPAAKEQVESLGGSFVMVDSDEMQSAETAGGYAREMSEEFQRRQAELVSEHIAKQDMVICTALIPGRAAPVLVTEDMVKSMKPGSVIVDLAVEQGGNCELSRLGEVVDAYGVAIIGFANMPGRVPADASALYAKNLLNFLTPLVDKDSGGLKIDEGDEIIQGVMLTHGGKIVHPTFAAAETPSEPVLSVVESSESESSTDASTTPEHDD